MRPLERIDPGNRGPLFQCLIHLNHKKMFAYMDYCLAMYGGFANIDM